MPDNPGRANLVPLAGVAFWGWQVQQVVFLYWMENLVIGGFNVLRMLARMLREPVVVAALIAMLVSHGWSFFRNYLGRGEYQRGDGAALMSAPYKRVFVTHIFIIFGGFLTIALKNQLPAMLLFVGLKTGFDLYFHRREHRRESRP